MPSPFSPVGDGVRVRLRVQPRARRNQVGGLAPEADGAMALKVAVTAPPEDGKANAAVIALLAETWDVPKSSLTVASGAADRRKTIHLQGDPGRLMQALELWLHDRGLSA
ncbi:MAG: DUF167 domain-containing protein [Dongiaceae bacterium]